MNYEIVFNGNLTEWINIYQCNEAAGKAGYSFFVYKDSLYRIGCKLITTQQELKHTNLGIEF